MLLEVRRLSVAYAGVLALHDVNFEVGEGQIVALIGATGAGKTTTLRTISGLLRPVRGQITFRGQRLDGQPAHRIAELGKGHDRTLEVSDDELQGLDRLTFTASPESLGDANVYILTTPTPIEPAPATTPPS